jgi:hypothetical protein
MSSSITLIYYRLFKKHLLILVLLGVRCDDEHNLKKFFAPSRILRFLRGNYESISPRSAGGGGRANYCAQLEATAMSKRSSSGLALALAVTNGQGFVVEDRITVRQHPMTRNQSLSKMMPLTSEISLLHDASNIALDVSTVVTRNTAWLRLCNVVGRIVILSADCIQGDGISPVEWVLQTTMLVIATRLLIQTAWPLMAAVLLTSSLSVKDRRAYALLFRPVGLTVLQFKTLLASKTLDWIEFQPNESMELTGQCMYFLYSGDINTYDADSKTRINKDVIGGIEITSTGKEIEQCVGHRIFGDVQFAKVLESSVYVKAAKNIKGDKRPRNRENETNLSSPSSSIVSLNGASVLRISTPRLLKLMENDDELSCSIQRFVLLSMQKKLSRAG